MNTSKLFGILMVSSLLWTLPLTGIGQVSEGDPAPDFIHQSLEGVRYQLSELEGKVVYIFFFGARCPHCEANGPATEKAIYQRFKGDTNFVALGLDTWNESSSSVESFRETTGITYPLLLNAEQTLVNYYGNSFSYDRSVVVDQEGKVAYKGTEYVDKDTTEVKQTISDLLETSTSIDDKSEQPFQVELHGNYPNPFNPTTTIRYDLNSPGKVTLKVFTVLGQPVATLVDDFKSAGTHSVTFDATNLSSGIYLYQLQTDDFKKTRKMIMTK